MHRRSWVLKRIAIVATVVLGVSGIAVALAGASAASHSALTPVTVYFNPGSADGADSEKDLATSVLEPAWLLASPAKSCGAPPLVSSETSRERRHRSISGNR